MHKSLYGSLVFTSNARNTVAMLSGGCGATRTLTMNRVGTSGVASIMLSSSSSVSHVNRITTNQARFQSSRPATFAEITEALSILESRIDFNDKELKTQYRKLVKKHHPDAGGSEEAMSKISVSYNLVTSLSASEKQHYEAQRKNATKPGGSGGGGVRGDGAGFYHQQGVQKGPGRGPHAYRTSSYEGSGFDKDWQQTADYAKAYAQGRQQHHYSYRRDGDNNSRAFTGDPFANMGMNPMNPFARAMRRAGAAQRGDASRIILRALLVYFVVSLFVAYMFRRYRDWVQDDGWKMAESLSRHEQMQELHRIRQELKEKMSAAEAARYQQNYGSGGTNAGMMGAFGQKRRHDDDMERVKELRALEYAKQRQLDMTNTEIKGWPKFDPTKGRIWRTATDPAGVVYFDPNPGENDPQQQQQQPPLANGGNYTIQNNNNHTGGQAPSTSRNSSSIINDAMVEQRAQQAEYIASKSKLAVERTTTSA